MWSSKYGVLKSFPLFFFKKKSDLFSQLMSIKICGIKHLSQKKRKELEEYKNMNKVEKYFTNTKK